MTHHSLLHCHLFEVVVPRYAELMHRAIYYFIIYCLSVFFSPSKQILKGVVSFVEVAAPERHVCKGKTD